MLALLISLFFHWIFDFLVELLPGAVGETVNFLSASTHFTSISRGVIDSRDVIYFVSFSLLGLILAEAQLAQTQHHRLRRNTMKLTKSTAGLRILLYVGIFLALNLIARQVYFRLDFTADKRYTLGKSTKEILKNLDDPITVTVYATQGEGIPPLFTTLVRDLRDMLVEYQKKGNGLLQYELINPNDDDAVSQEVQQTGIYPFRIQVVENDRTQEMLAFLGAVVKRGNQREVIQAFNPQRFHGIRSLICHQKTHSR